MKLVMTKRNKYLLTGGLLLLTATPSFALFGIGDIVFDPTSYASLVSQLTTLESQYKMLQNNITHFSLKQQWQTTLNAMKNANVANMFGETSGMSIALNTNSPSASSTAWTAGTIKVSGNTTSYLQGQTPGGAQLSQLAMIEASDSISPDCLTAVGQYRGRGHRTSPRTTRSPRSSSTPAMAPTPKSSSSISSMQRKPRRCPRCNRRVSCKPALLHR